MKLILQLLILGLVTSVSAKAQTDSKDSVRTMSYTLNSNTVLVYSRPKSFEFITALPRDYGDFCKDVFRKDQLINIGLIAGSTVLLVAYDQTILDNAKNFGRTIHLSGTSNQKPIIDQKVTIAKKEIKIQFNVPTDLNSSFYYLGDGWTHTSIALAFWVSGLISKDYRSLRTASELGECILSTGIATQFIKHITGRESPYTTNVRGGVWRFFPNQKQYANHTPQYDAFPTGHLATAMATVTVIAENYPDKRYIRPVGYTLMGLLGFAMLNNGVHWAGDYPLGIAMGYIFAKVAVNHGRTIHADHQSMALGNHWKFSPSLALINNDVGMSMGIRWSIVRGYKQN